MNKNGWVKVGGLGFVALSLLALSTGCSGADEGVVDEAGSPGTAHEAPTASGELAGDAPSEAEPAEAAAAIGEAGRSDENLNDHTGYRRVTDPVILEVERDALERFSLDGPSLPYDNNVEVKSLDPYVSNVAPWTIVGVAIYSYEACAGWLCSWTDDVYTYTTSGTVFEGTSTNLTQRNMGGYDLPGDYTYSDIRAMAFSPGSTDTGTGSLFVWYSDGKVSAGTHFHPYTRRLPYTFTPPAGFSALHLQEVGIASTHKCYYYWLKDSSGASATRRTRPATRAQRRSRSAKG
jgi:hypothetical protein